MRRKGIIFIPVIVLIMATTLFARLVQDIYAGKIVILDQLAPRFWPNDNWILNFLKKHSVTKIQENEKKEWVVNFMAFFKTPINDREVNVIFYDINDGFEKYIISYQLMLMDSSVRIIGDKQILTRDHFKPNRWYKMKIISKGKKVAESQKFALIGSEPQRTGEVIFTVEETKGR